MNDDITSLKRELTGGGCLPAEAVRAILEREGIGLETLMLRLLPLAAARARAPVSHFAVGAVAAGRAADGRPGALYLGANLEFTGVALGCTVHAEQSAVNNAWLHGEGGLSCVALTAPPCGHCRQFLCELASAGDLQILVNREGSGAKGSYTKHSLGELLPAAFGPGDLGVTDRLMQSTVQRLPINESSDPLVRAAGAAAAASYAPYTGNFAGVALRTADGDVVCGRVAENAAFNPTLPPMASALAELQMLRGPGELQITHAVLVEAGAAVSQHSQSAALLRSVGGDGALLRHQQVKSA
jgi:cytidine deaminase